MNKLSRMLMILVLFAVTGVARATLPAPAIDLDANNLTLGYDVIQWVNATTCGYGLAGKKFIACGQPPTCGITEGRKAVTFNGVNGFISQPDFDGVPWSLPAAFSGANPWTVSYTVLNPNVKGNEWLFGWTRYAIAARNGAFFGYGSDDVCGAVSHGGAGCDMGFDRGVPPAGGWHTITVTYSGASGWEKVYVDGELNAIEKKPTGKTLDLTPGEPIYLGVCDAASAANNFSGSLAALQLYAAEASYDEVRALAGLAPAGDPSVPNVPALVNPSFELVQGDLWVVPSGSRMPRCAGDYRTIPGWAWAPADGYPGNSARRTGVGINIPNRGKTFGAGSWDNGLGADGTRVLALDGATTQGQAISQYVLLKQGITYHFKIHYNAATTSQPIMNVKVGGASLPGLPLAVNAVEGQWAWTKPFRVYEGDFTATATGLTELQICQERAGMGNVLLVDKVELYEARPTQLLTMPANLDFGPVQKGLGRDQVLHVQNVGSATLNLVGYGNSAVNGDDSTRVNFTDPVKPGRSSGTPNIAIKGYQSTELHLRFTAGTAMRNYGGQLTLNYGNGTTSGTWTLPWTALVPSSPTLVNGSFELPYNSNELQAGTAWYNSYGGNVAIPGWLDNQTTQGIGVGEYGYYQMVTGAAIPDGRQGLWIQCLAPDTATTNTWYAGSSRSVSQLVPGFAAGHDYRIVMFVNARSALGTTNKAYFQFKINGATMMPVSFPMGATYLASYNGYSQVIQISRQFGNWLRLEYFYHQGTSDGANWLELAAIADLNGETCLNVDNIKIYDIASAPASRVGDAVGCGGGITMPVDLGTGTSRVSAPYASSKIIRLYNEGGTTLTLSGMSITGPNTRAFTLSTALPSGGAKIVGAGNYYNISVQFTPKTIDVGGIGSAYLTLATNDTTKTTNIPLYGVANIWPVIVNADFQMPPAYFDNTGTIWRCLGINLNPAGWTLTSGLTNFTSGNNNFGNCNINVTGQIGVCVPLNSAYQQGFYADNGMTQNQVAYIHVDPQNGPGNSAGAPKGMMQVVNGFQVGQMYHLKVLVNAAYIGPNNDHAVKGVIFHYQMPGSSTWMDLAAPKDVYAVDEQYNYATPYAAIEGDIMCPVTGAYKIELWVPQQNDESTLLVQGLPFGMPCRGAVEKSWSRYE